MKATLIKCKTCGADFANTAKACPNCGAKNCKPIYKRWWFWVIAVLIVISVIPAKNTAKDVNTESKSTANTSVITDTDSKLSYVGNDAAPDEDDSVSTEYKNALKKAKTYSDLMHMSKTGIYEQLTSEYGEKFPEDAAQYAIDNVDADWKANALEKAKMYQETMSMSKSAIYDQLVSEYGEQFTVEEAQYAIDNLK